MAEKVFRVGHIGALASADNETWSRRLKTL